jgi:hypothetical protein
LVPSASTTFLIMPTGAPLLAGWIVTVTSSPGLNDRLDQPRFDTSATLLVATDQFLTVPSAPLTSIPEECSADSTR